MSEKAKALFLRRRLRVRRNLRRAPNNRPRLSVFRSSKHIDGGLKTGLKTGADIAAASAVGKLVAERAKAAGVEQVVFDRGAYLFHGRVKALADAAREGGLDF
jgi:large subunit ribosomal protein L18